jgi:hypothetical protein
MATPTSDPTLVSIHPMGKREGKLLPDGLYMKELPGNHSGSSDRIGMVSMKRLTRETGRWLGWLPLALVVVGVPAALAQAQARPGPPPAPPGFLTDPAPGDPLDLSLRYLRENRASLGLTAADLDEWVLGDRVTSPHTGLTHLYLRQRLAGIDVLGGDLTVSVTTDGRLIGLRSDFVPGLAGVVNTRAPVLTQTESVEAAAVHLGLRITVPITVEERKGGPMRAVVLSDGGISRCGDGRRARPDRLDPQRQLPRPSAAPRESDGWTF